MCINSHGLMIKNSIGMVELKAPHNPNVKVSCGPVKQTVKGLILH